MQPVTIVYVTDMDGSLAFYRRLLPHAELVSQSPHWSELSFGPASIALHSSAQVIRGTQLGLALTADESLEAVQERLTADGLDFDPTIEPQPFGRSMLIRDLDGLPIQINEHAG